MTAITHWNGFDGEGADDSWSLVGLGGKYLWVATVDVEIDSGLDVQKPKGAAGATIKDNGDPPKKVKIRLQMASRPELDAFAAARSILLARKKGGARDPIEIEHPNTAFWGITSIVVDKIRSPSPDPVNGWEVSLDCLEWKPAPAPVKVQAKKPKTASKTPTADTTATDGGREFVFTRAPQKLSLSGT